MNIAQHTNGAEEMAHLEMMLTAMNGILPPGTLNNARDTAAARPQWFTTAEGLIVGEFLEQYNLP